MTKLGYARIVLKNDRPNFSSKPFFLRITAESSKTLTGVEVGLDGDAVVRNVGGKRVDETKHIIDKTCIASRIPMVMNLTYAMLEPETQKS